jgi:hypothetical protein
MKMRQIWRGRLFVVVVALSVALISGVALSAEQRGGAVEARVLGGARFALIVDGVEIASFTRFDSTVDPASSFARIITLSGGQTYSMEMASWHETVIIGDVAAARKNCTIVMYSAGGSPVATYSIQNAWPRKYTGVAGKQHLTEAVMLEYESAEVRTHE